MTEKVFIDTNILIYSIDIQDPAKETKQLDRRKIYGMLQVEPTD